MKTEPIEALKEIKHCTWIAGDFNISDGFESYEVVDEDDAINIANIAFREGQSSPIIKKLEWGCEGFHRTDGSLPDEICASTPLGAKYYIYRLLDAGFQLTYGYRTIATYLDHGVEDVKAIAQADFEKRVMECLDL